MSIRMIREAPGPLHVRLWQVVRNIAIKVRHSELVLRESWPAGMLNGCPVGSRGEPLGTGGMEVIPNTCWVYNAETGTHLLFEPHTGSGLNSLTHTIGNTRKDTTLSHGYPAIFLWRIA